MRVVHPLWRGFYLAAAMAAALVLLGPADALAAYGFDRRMLALCGGMLCGAFLGAVPSRLTRRRKPAPRTTWQRCLRAFFCGAAMILGYAMAGGGRMLGALMEGSVGAYAFGGAALAAGFVTVRIMERGRGA